MSHVKNKTKWCLDKAEKELKKVKSHRGLMAVGPSLEKARQYLAKADHYLKATDYLKQGNFSDISASTVFYCMYHCLLAIAAKFGYESRNQECTFALISALIEDGQIDLEQSMLDKLATVDVSEDSQTSLEIREQYQYGTNLSLKNEAIYKDLVSLAKDFLTKTRAIVEKK